MRIAVMQPYLFPYVPYFQLIHAVDCFVILDTVQFIRRGWMNRNRIRLGDTAQPFTIPVRKAPQTAAITEIVFAANVEKECRRLGALLAHAYAKTSCWPQLEKTVGALLRSIRAGGHFVDLTEHSLKTICAVLGIDTPFVRASALAVPKCDSAQQYLIAICEELNATEYVNPVGGRHLYKRTAFGESGITLSFLSSEAGRYRQRGEGFIAGLSILDTLANLESQQLRDLMRRYRLEP